MAQNQVTREQMRDRIRSRADMENTDFVTDSEINVWIDDGCSELYDIIVSKNETYFFKTEDKTLVDGTSSYSLPIDFYRMQAVGIVPGSGGEEYSIHPFNLKERNIDIRQLLGHYESIYRYMIQGDNIKLIPVPGTGTLRLYYTPQITLMTADTNTFTTVFEGAAQPGWQEFVEISAAIKCLEKEESDSSHLVRSKMMIQDRVVRMSENRDEGRPQSVHDITIIDYERGLV